MAKETKKLEISAYTLPTCPYCMKLKQYFAEKGIKFRNIDVSNDNAAIQEMIKKSGQSGVPVIEINGKLIIGFDKEALEDALRG